MRDVQLEQNAIGEEHNSIIYRGRIVLWFGGQHFYILHQVSSLWWLDIWPGVRYWHCIWLLLTVYSILKYCLKYVWSFRGGSRISERGVQMHKVVGVRFDDLTSFFLNIRWYHRIFKNGSRGGGFKRIPSGSATELENCNIFSHASAGTSTRS